MKKFVMMCGLPRTGSTLLSSILAQNPLIHSAGQSAVCQLLWDTKISFENQAVNQVILSNKKPNLKYDLMRSIVDVYYKEVHKPIIVDKCWYWNNPENVQLLKEHLDPDPKFIVLLRPFGEIIASFVNLANKNKVNWLSEETLLDSSSTLMRSAENILWNKTNNENGNFLFVKYDSLVNDMPSALTKIYEFCGWEPYIHNLNRIINETPEDDTVYELIGMHDVRSKISVKKNKVKLSKKTIELCSKIDEQIYEGL